MRWGVLFIAAVWAAVIAAGLFVSGCAHKQTSALSICPPVKAYSAETQARLAVEVAALPPASPLVGLVLDYQALRDAARACVQAGAAAR